MFLIFGINQNEKQLSFNQNAICKYCGKYGHITIRMRYTYFMLFFIPLFVWNRHYFAVMDCCGAICELDAELGRAVETGKVSSIDIDSLGFEKDSIRRCRCCGYTTEENFQYCPKCGRPF